MGILFYISYNQGLDMVHPIVDLSLYRTDVNLHNPNKKQIRVIRV